MKGKSDGVREAVLPEPTSPDSDDDIGDLPDSWSDLSEDEVDGVSELNFDH